MYPVYALRPKCFFPWGGSRVPQGYEDLLTLERPVQHGIRQLGHPQTCSEAKTPHHQYPYLALIHVIYPYKHDHDD